VGADAAEKRELEGSLLAGALVVADSLSQCLEIGELHHAVAEGAMSVARVHAELAEVVAGARPGRRSAEEIIVFDSTGVAIEDVAAMARVYERAVALGCGGVWEISEAS
jgi:ornithine cyclodeaminase/alanine dehydrogenase-like protein (mu-crystallin family)